MRKSLLILTIMSSIISYSAEFRDGLYRGVFVSGKEPQVEVQFNLKDDTVKNPKYRTLAYKGTDYLKEKSVADQKVSYRIWDVFFADVIQHNYTFSAWLSIIF